LFSSALTTPDILFSELFSNEIIFFAGDWSKATISPIISSFPFNLDNESKCSSPIKKSDSMEAAFKDGWSESLSFLNSFRTLAGPLGFWPANNNPENPFKTFQAANLARADDRSKFARDLFVDELQGQRDIEEAILYKRKHMSVELKIN